ncbi:MAG: large subunit ribosomal protein L25 [Halothiobacillaceae bacterium]|nr:MAG: large subunit ribosomal protein L25 [Halothiobacillaceae bacterium]
MSKLSFELKAEVRTGSGTSAARRLRGEGKVPGIVYGAGEPLAVSVDHNTILKSLEHEAFYSHVLTLDCGGKQEKVVLKAVDRHPYKAQVLHLDFQRVDESSKLRKSVPLHFIGEASAVGVKQGGQITHAMSNVEVVCLAKDLPEYIEVDVSNLQLEQTLHLSDLQLPAGVQVAALLQGEEHNLPVVAIHKPRGAVSDEVATTPAA